MAACLESRGDRIVLRFKDSFGASDEWELHGLLKDSPPAYRIVVDVSQVRHFHDVAIGMLARDMQEAPERVSVTGLRQHQRRMLRIFGVDVPARDPPEDLCK